MGEQNLAAAYRELNVRGPVFVHADLSVAQTTSWLVAARTMHDSLDGYEIIVPTFTYSFCDGVPFDIKHSPAEGVGMFPEFYRIQSGVKRTPHGVFSVAGQTIPNIDDNAFGPGSVFSWLHGMDATFLFIGCSFQRCTFVHYIEQTVGVDYRYLKEFTGLVVDESGNTSIQTFHNYVRDLDRGVETTLDDMEQRLLASGRLKRVRVGDYNITAGRASDIYRGVTEALRNDPYCLVRFKPKEAA